jgi:hypothetical protein
MIERDIPAVRALIQVRNRAYARWSAASKDAHDPHARNKQAKLAKLKPLQRELALRDTELRLLLHDYARDGPSDAVLALLDKFGVPQRRILDLLHIRLEVLELRLERSERAKAKLRAYRQKRRAELRAERENNREDAA